MIYPSLNEQSRSRIVTETFRGYDHRLKILPGQWYDEENITAAHYPLFSQRAKRGRVLTMDNPLGLLAKDALMYIDGSSVYYNGLRVEGVNLSTAEDMLPKQLVSMGAYAVIFPDKVYINTADLSDVGSLDARFAALSTDNVSVQLCRADGAEYEAPASAEAPANPANGDMWIDTSGDTHVLRQYSEYMSSWSEVPTVYVRVGCKGVGVNFSAGDGVRVSGLVSADAAVNAQLKTLMGDGYQIVQALGDDYLVLTGILDGTHSQTGGLVITRDCPDMDYVTESDNRIWGCRYGLVDGETVNEIYACKLGDPKNWRAYAGLSTDSYAVSVGSDGKFTGAATHLGYPLFFKEGCIHKIYGSLPESFQVNTTMCRGVQDGAWRSLAIVNEVLYYQSRTDICAYDGSLPAGVSDELGGVKYTLGAAGSDGAVYYISMRDAAGGWHMFTYDTDKAMWHREDGVHALCFANVRGDLMYIDADTRSLMSACGRSGEPEGEVSWRAESGIMGYEYPYSQYLSRFNIRARLGEGAKMTMSLEYDSEDGWVEMGTYSGTAAVRTVNIPVIPRRCDHLRLKLSGVGDVKIYSISRILEGGSDVWR